MKNIGKIKRGLNYLICAMIAFALLLACLMCVPSVHAAEPDDFDEVTVTDGQFNISGSSVIKNPSSWTGDYIGGFGGQVISGVVDLSANADTNDSFMEATKLDRYAEFKNKKPETPFGRNTDNQYGNWFFPGTNSKALMINTNDRDSKRGTAYGYKSGTIELSANSFYKFSVWAKTGSFPQGRGAVIKLSGFDHDVGFWNVDNSDSVDNGLFGFSEYVIYVATSQNAASVTINLQVGDSYTYSELGAPDYMEYITPSSGYAFFDNVTCYKYSANAFYEETYGLLYDTEYALNDNETVMIHDFNTFAPGNNVTIAGNDDTILKNENGDDIGSFANGTKGWTLIDKETDTASGQYLYANTYNAGVPFDGDNKIGLESNPFTPRGDREFCGDRNILVLSADTDAYIALQSDDITIRRNKFYRLSLWANSQNFDDDSNAQLVIAGENNLASTDYELTPVVISDVEGTGDNDSRYGWKRYFFFIRGSIAKDCKINLQLWLGRSSNCTGTVMFDDVRLEEVTYTYYNNNSSAGTTVSFENAPSATVDNGRFYNAENYGEEFPLRPVQWTSIGDVPDSAVSGVIYTDEVSYRENYTKYFGVPNPISEAPNMTYNSTQYPTLLLLAAREQSYFGYSSPSLSLTSGNDYKISITMRTIDMQGSGANLRLAVNDRTIASIKNIGSTSEFTTYEFYIEGDKAFASGTGIDYTATLYITLGSEEAKASGSVYVSEVASATLTEGDFATKYDEFKLGRGTALGYDMYSFKSLDFFGYDNTDENAIKESTSWAITDATEQSEGKYVSGVFDPNRKTNNGSDAYLRPEITAAYNKLENKADQVYTLRTRNTAVTSQLINPLKLEPNSYYMVSVAMAVVLNEDNAPTSVGAGLYLSGTGYSDTKFENIRTTTDLIDKYQFKTFQFYIASGDADTTVYLRATLGDAAYMNRYVSGELYIAYVSLTNLGSSDESLVETDTLKIINNHVDASTDETDEDTENPDEDQDDESSSGTLDTSENERWWLIPSILFGVAILLAIVGFVIRAIVERVSRRQRKKGLSSYDRAYNSVPEDNGESEKFDDDKIEVEEVTVKKVVDKDVEAFNDDEPETVEVTEKTEKELEKAEEVKKPKQHDDLNDFEE